MDLQQIGLVKPVKKMIKKTSVTMHIYKRTTYVRKSSFTSPYCYNFFVCALGQPLDL